MNVLVDTSVWSVALRRARVTEPEIVAELASLVHDGRVAMMGAIRQELLSGMRTPTQFENLRDRLRAFPDLDVSTEDFEEAAAIFNRCRQRGIQGSNTDFLICAVAMRYQLAIFTTDDDFVRYAKVAEITLHRVSR